MEDYTLAVRQNVLIAMKAMIEATDTLEIPIEEESNQKLAQEFLQETETTEDLSNLVNRFDNDLIKKLQYLWNDKGIQKVYEMRSKFQLSDSTG